MGRLRGVAVAGALLTMSACAPSGATYGGGDDWTWTETAVAGPQRTQGIATDDVPAVASLVDDTWYTSQFSLERAAPDGSTLGINGSLPPDVLLIWKHSHTGDPDAHAGRVVVPWENKQLGPSSPPSKAFGVYDGASLDLVGWSKHVLVDGESNDNPWVTIAPGGRWMVSGPYEPLDRLEVFPVPDASFGDLPLTATIPLDRPPAAIQGCDFVTDTQLVCASDDEHTGKQVLLVDLDAPVGDGASIGAVTYVGPAPQAPPLIPGENALCGASGEVEGVDARHVDGVGTVVRLLVIDRCKVIVHEYRHVIPD